MKVLDLQCAQGHSFEGWFGSQEDYDSQRAKGLVSCPVCNDSDILKKLSAPRLNLGHGAEAALAPTGPQAAVQVETHLPAQAPTSESSIASQRSDLARNPDTLQQMQAAMMNMVRHVITHTEDVGTQFAEEARKIHYGEREERNIRGQATREETQALIDEGIDVLPLPVPENLKGTLQ